MKVNELVQCYLETKDEQYFKELIDIFEPLILSYAHRLYYLEKDDSVQELTLALFESISTIHDTSDTAMCFSYIQSAIYHRFCKLYYKSKTAKEQIDRHVYIDVYKRQVLLGRKLQRLFSQICSVRMQIHMYIP